MTLFSMHCHQQLPITLDEAWAFISNPGNLSVITPPDMNFTIISPTSNAIYAGQLIEYKVSPFKGIAVDWVTEITHVSDRQFFVDEQRFGPYAFWHHKHFLKEIPGGVEMDDIIHYKLPMGPIGGMFNPLIVKPKLTKIFEFRKQKLTALFGDFKNPQQ